MNYKFSVRDPKLKCVSKDVPIITKAEPESKPIISSNLLTIEEEYKRILDSLNHEPHHVNRDGDLFTIICPKCGSRNTAHVGSYFICARRHIFSLYTEDGVHAESDLSEERKKRILGDDLDPKTLKDAHGHEEYDLFDKDDIVPMYFKISLWGLDHDNRTLVNTKTYIDIFRNKIGEFKDKFKRFSLSPLYFMTDFDEALQGKTDYRVHSNLMPMWMQKAIVISDELDKIDKYFGNEEIYVSLVYVK